MLYAHSKFSESNSAWILLVNTRRGESFASVGLVVHEFGRDPAYRVFIYSRMDLHFWGCQAGIRTRDRLTAVRRANLSATPHPSSRPRLTPYWLSASLAHLLLALAISLRRQVGLYAHSKCLGNCSMRIQNMAGAALFYHISAQSNTIGLRDINRAALAIFWMRIEQIRIRLEQL